MTNHLGRGLQKRLNMWVVSQCPCFFFIKTIMVFSLAALGDDRCARFLHGGHLRPRAYSAAGRAACAATLAKPSARCFLKIAKMGWWVKKNIKNGYTQLVGKTSQECIKHNLFNHVQSISLRICIFLLPMMVYCNNVNMYWLGRIHSQSLRKMVGKW